MALRSRSRDTTESTSVNITDMGSGTSYFRQYPANQRGGTEGITEMLTPRWKRMVSEGSIIIGEMDRQIVRRSPGSALLHETYPPWGWDYEVTGDIAGCVRNAVAAPSRSDNTAKLAELSSRALHSARAKAHESMTLGGETLAQMGETIKMLRRPFSSAGRLLRKTTRIRDKKLRKSASNLTQANADAWLETTYGWKPLIMDVMNIMSVAERLRSNFERRLVFRATETFDSNSEHPFSAVRLSGDLDFLRCNGSYTKVTTLRASAGVIVDIKMLTPTEMLAKIFGFRARDLPSTLWALMPYSFVLDWWGNVETWFQSVMPDPGVIHRGSWVTTVDETSVRCNGGSFYTDTVGPKPSTSGDYTADLLETISIVRTPNPSMWTPPAISFESLSLSRNISAVSLMVGPLMGSTRNFAH